MVFAVWSKVTYTNTCFMKWSWNTKTLAALGDWLGSKVVSMLVKSTCRRSRKAVAMMGCNGPWASCPHAVDNMCRFWWIAASGWSSLATKSALAISTRYGHSLDVLHLDSIHSEWWPYVPLGPQRAANLHSCPWVLSIGKGLSDES